MSLSRRKHLIFQNNNTDTVTLSKLSSSTTLSLEHSNFSFSFLIHEVKIDKKISVKKIEIRRINKQKNNAMILYLS